MKNQTGFTLVEIMVVVAITAVIGIVAVTSFRSFREDQDLQSSFAGIQAQLRVVQTNAMTNFNCKGNSALGWSAKFSASVVAGQTRYKLENNCQYAGVSAPTGCLLNAGIVTCTTNTFSMEPKIVIDKIYTSESCQVTALSAESVTITFASLNGAASFGATSSTCIAASTTPTLTISLVNTKPQPNTSLLLGIDMGGAIHGQ